MEETKLKEYRKNFIEYIKKFESKRKKFYDRVYNTMLNEKSESKKLCLMIWREIYEENEENKFYEEDIIFKGDLRDNIIEKINEGIKNDLDLNIFINELCGLSPAIDFNYKFSE